MLNKFYTKVPQSFYVVFLIGMITTGCVLISSVYAQPSSALIAQATPSVTKKTKKQKSQKRRKVKKKKKKKASDELAKTDGQVIEFKQLSVEGTVQRPSAAYLLQRRTLKFKGLEPKKSFLPQILNSVKKPPF